MKQTDDPKFLKLLLERFGIVGRSRAMGEAIDILLQAAPTDLSVLITGETGTGKEIFARAIHGLSKRKDAAYISVNTGAIPENLLESELFGHEKGAFTGASDLRIGFFESADKGTIFLDEIGEMPINTQVKLLRILESGEYSRLGSSKVRKVDVRIIAATNRNLEDRVKTGDFRQDLYFRLNSVQIELPSLRNHPDDIPYLIDYFGNQITKKLTIDYKGIDSDAVSILKNLPWPGNIRELRNMIETMLTLEKAEFITPDMVRKYVPRALPAYENQPILNEKSIIPSRKEEQSGMELGLIFKTLLELKSEVADIKHIMNDLYDDVAEIKRRTENLEIEEYEEVKSMDQIFDSIGDMKLDELEKKMIETSLKKFDGNRRLAAESLGISQRTLYRKLSEYGIE
jgi:DNA-binding NtrC family response regulator